MLNVEWPGPLSVVSDLIGTTGCDERTRRRGADGGTPFMGAMGFAKKTTWINDG